MSDTLDLINTVRLHDNSLSNQNRDLQYDLDRRADRIARKTGNAPLDWDEFSEKFHPQKEMDGLTHATNWGFKGGLLGVVGGIILAGLSIMSGDISLIAGAVGADAVLSGIAMLGGGAILGGIIGSISGALLSLVDDQKPEIRQEQLKKYKSYLDEFELNHEHTQQSDMQQASTKWREHAELSKESSPHVLR